MEIRSNALIAALAAAALANAPLAAAPSPAPGYTVEVDGTRPGAILPNASQVMTIWNGRDFNWDGFKIRDDYPITNFVRFVELMACTGGNRGRDLFVNSDDRTRLDDYDFRPLVAICRNVLRVGLKPYLKLGNVPAKFTSDYEGGEFSMNVRPPSDPRTHYRYMKACAAALADAFGRDEVRTWRFSVLTEADNPGWFACKSGDAAANREAFFSLYDHTARAFTEVLGPDIAFGTHLLYPSDARTDQFKLLDVARHCREKSLPLKLLTVSYYGRPDRDDLHQGHPDRLRDIWAALGACGFTNAVTGVDEGRVIVGSIGGAKNNELLTRAVGASYQAAFDVRIHKTLFDHRCDYFAAWGYYAGPSIHFEGLPTFGYFTAREIARFEGLRRLPATAPKKGLGEGEEVDVVAAISADGRSCRVMVGRFRDKLQFSAPLAAKVKIVLPDAAKGRSASISTLVLDDRNNWFLDWEADSARHNIGSGDFAWSPQDPAPMSTLGLQKPEHRKLFAELSPKYAKKAASVKPVKTTCTAADDGTVEVPLSFVGNGAAFVSVEF